MLLFLPLAQVPNSPDLTDNYPQEGVLILQVPGNLRRDSAEQETREVSHSIVETHSMSAPSSSSSASTLITETIIGSHDFTIKGYSLNRGTGKFLKSETFTIGGGSWSIRCGPPEQGDETGSGYVDLNNATKVIAKSRITLLHHTGNEKRAMEFTNDVRSFSGPSCCWNWKFPSRAELEANYLKNDCLHIRCCIGVVQSRMEVRSISVPPSDMLHCLGSFLNCRHGSDVSFEVDGQIFYAHKFLLAARSPVFNAQFWGLMKDQNAQCIKVEDIKAPTFKAMLYFIYHDDLPDLKGTNSKESSTLMFQRLFAAADRYQLDRLLLLCAAKLYEDIAVDTAATTLVLAEQHNCVPLKSACLKYIALPQNLQAVLKTDAIKCLKESYFNVYVELLEHIAGILTS